MCDKTGADTLHMIASLGLGVEKSMSFSACSSGLDLGSIPSTATDGYLGQIIAILCMLFPLPVFGCVGYLDYKCFGEGTISFYTSVQN